MKHALYGLTGLVMVLGLQIGRAEEKKLDEKASLWMTKKVEFAQKILAGLTKGDFADAEAAARDMYAVGYLEKWDMAGLPAYRKQVKAFDAATKELKILKFFVKNKCTRQNGVGYIDVQKIKSTASIVRVAFKTGPFDYRDLYSPAFAKTTTCKS